MTDIAFHFNVSEPIGYTLRLLRKAYRSGAQVVVFGDAPVVNALDGLMWSSEATEFLPHCLAQSASTACLAASPVVLVNDMQTNSFYQDVLVNLQRRMPPSFAQFARVIEIVSLEEADRLAARERWRFYASRGYSMSRHEARTAIKSA